MQIYSHIRILTNTFDIRKYSHSNKAMRISNITLYVCADQAYDQNAVNAVREVSLKNWEVHILCSMELSSKYGN